MSEEETKKVVIKDFFKSSVLINELDEALKFKPNSLIGIDQISSEKLEDIIIFREGEEVGVTGGGLLFSIYFNAVSSGTSNIKLANVLLANSGGESITTSSVNTASTKRSLVCWIRPFASLKPDMPVFAALTTGILFSTALKTAIEKC